MAFFTIGQVAQQTGIKVPTLRYYEQAGLIPMPDRSEGRQRRYYERDVERLRFVRHARQLGFSLSAIASLIELSESDDRNDCDLVHDLAENHLQAVRSKLKLLRGLEKELKRIVAGCNSGHIGECYVVHSLARHEWCESEHETLSPADSEFR